MTDYKTKKGYFFALLAGFSWAFMGIFVKNLNDINLDSMTISAFRPTIGVIFYILITLSQNPQAFKTDLKGLFLFAIYGVFALDGMFIASSYAIEYTGVSMASVLLFTNPIIVVILSYFLFNEKFTFKKTIAIILALAGCCLVVKAYDTTSFQLNLKGIIWGLLSGVSVALQNILAKTALRKYSYQTLIVYSFLFAAIFLWFFIPPWVLIKSINSSTSFMNIIGLGFIATLIPNEAMIRALKYIEAGKTSIIASIEPVIASILAFIFFGEFFEFPQFVGITFIIISILLIQSKENNKSNEKSFIIKNNILTNNFTQK